MNASYNRASAAYGAASRTVSPISAIVMLFDGALKQLRIAVEEDKAKHPIERYRAAEKALKILRAMQATLNFEEAGDIAHSLDRFYTVVCRELMVATTHPDAGARLQRLIEQIRPMRDAWAIRGGLNDAAAQAAPPVGATQSFAGAA